MKAAAVKQAKERDEFIRLSDMALAAARAGDCTSAFAIEERVRALDRVVHATVLAPAPTMQACRDLVQRREPSLNTR